MRPPPPTREAEDMLMRPAPILLSTVLPVVVVTTAVAVVASLRQGVDGFVGAVLGGLLVIVFFGADRILDIRTRRAQPVSVMALAMGGYAAKVLLLGVLLVLLADTTLFSTTAFGVSILAGAVVWLVADVRAFMRRRMLYVDTEESAP